MRLLPLFNATLAHHDQHKADTSSYSNRKVRGVAPPIGRGANTSQLRVRECRDCLHCGYSPALYDELVVFTPLHALLEGALRTRVVPSPRGAGGPAGGTGLAASRGPSWQQTRLTTMHATCHSIIIFNKGPDMILII